MTDTYSLSKPSSTFKLTRGFWAHLTRRRKRQLGVLLMLMVLASFAEMLSLGAVLPFLGILTTPDRVFNHDAIQPWLQWMNIQNAHELLLPVTILFVVAVMVAGGMRLLLLYISTKLSFAISADMSYEIYRRTLYQPYSVHVARNSSEVINGIIGKANVVIQMLLVSWLNLISSSFIWIAILAALLAVDTTMTLVAFAGLGGIYGVIVLSTRKRLAYNSQHVSSESTEVVKVLQEGLGGIRDVLLDGSQDEYCRKYRKADLAVRHAMSSSVVVSGSPRFVVEALGMVFIAALAYFMTRRSEDVMPVITTLGVLALGAQRLLPVLQQVYTSITSIRSNKDSLLDALKLLNQPVDFDVYGSTDARLIFDDCIRLQNLSFSYTSNSRQVIQNLNLDIPRGARVGFIGTTGSGKSTLLDIIMGLLPPTEGEVSIDGTPLQVKTVRAWQRHIAHVPQAIYLSDSSIAENIAFGIPREEIDMSRVCEAARQAQIAEYIESLNHRYETTVGERGVRLSGGQRQRIGIARALYKQADVIVFDEATSALDNETEHAVMSAIEGLRKDLTILIIAHRVSTLQNCDRIVELSEGRIVRSGTYDEMISAPIHINKIVADKRE